MRNLFSIRRRLLAGLTAALLLGAVAPASAGPFTPGNIVVARVGATGSPTALATSATAVFLDEYTPAGVLVQTVALPTAATGPNRALTASGSSTTEVNLTRSADGRYLVLTGYDAAPGTTSISGTASTTTSRVIGRIAADGSFDTSTSIGDAFSAVSIRAAATADGQRFYAVGASSGVRYVPFGNPAATATLALNATPTNLRYVGIFGGNLYVSSGSAAPLLGVSQIGTGLPTTAGQANALLPGTGSASPYAFFLADLSPAVAGVDVLYVADDNATTGGIFKYSLVNGTWAPNGPVLGPGSAALRGLTGRVSGSTVSLFATGGTTSYALYALTDNAGYNVAPSTTTLPAALATAPANTAFRGVAFAPVAATTTASRASRALPGLSIFPVPAQDQLTVALPRAGAARVALRDRLVLTSAALLASGRLRLPAALPAGTYLLEVRQGAETAVRRVVKE